MKKKVNRPYRDHQRTFYVFKRALKISQVGSGIPRVVNFSRYPPSVDLVKVFLFLALRPKPKQGNKGQMKFGLMIKQNRLRLRNRECYSDNELTERCRKLIKTEIRTFSKRITMIIASKTHLSLIIYRDHSIYFVSRTQYSLYEILRFDLISSEY